MSGTVLPCESPPGIRIGATSYVLPDDILPNVEYLAPLVDDVELVLFESDDYGTNLPDRALVARLAALAADHDLTYTVHLPLDLRLDDQGTAHDVSLVKARRVIEATQDLDPYAYVLHLDGRTLGSAPPLPAVGAWQERSYRALAIVCEWLEQPERLAIENVEGWNPDLLAPIMDRLPTSRVIDVGHLWLQGVDPVAHLARWSHRARVIHLHGICERDHSSLAHVAAAELDSVVGFLPGRFRGVVTLEVFNLDDFSTSMETLRHSLSRIGKGG